MSPNKASSPFTQFAKWTSKKAGQPVSFGIAVVILLVWGISGPIFHFSDTWQLVINTGTTIVTFLMVFLIQNTQNRDSEAIHIKLDELIWANKRARNTLLDLEEMEEKELDKVRDGYEKIADQARKKPQQLRSSTASQSPVRKGQSRKKKSAQSGGG